MYSVQQVFIVISNDPIQTELGINTHGMVTDIHRIVLNGQGIGSPVSVNPYPPCLR